MSKARLFRSIKALDVNAVASLLEAQPELTRATDDRRRNPLHFLCSLPADPNPVTEDETPFLGAIKWSRFVGAERLLRHGANVNFQNSKGVTALHVVLKKGSNREHVLMLLRHGADPTIKSKDGKSPLDLVATRRDKTYFDLLSHRRVAPAR